MLGSTTIQDDAKSCKFLSKLVQFVAVVVVIVVVVVFAVLVEAVNSVKFFAYDLLLRWTSHTNSTHKQLVQMEKSKLLFVSAPAKICASVTSETIISLYASLEQRSEQAGLSKLGGLDDWQAERRRRHCDHFHALCHSRVAFSRSSSKFLRIARCSSNSYLTTANFPSLISFPFPFPFPLSLTRCLPDSL